MSPCVIGLGSIRFHFLCSMKLFFLYINLTNFVISCTSLQFILFLMVTFKDSFLNSTMPENWVGLFFLSSCIFGNTRPIFIQFVLKCTEHKALSDGGFFSKNFVFEKSLVLACCVTYGKNTYISFSGSDIIIPLESIHRFWESRNTFIHFLF